MKAKYGAWLMAAVVMLVSSCSVSTRINRQAHEALLDNPKLQSANIGISVYDAGERAFIYRHNGEKLFLPSSNVKLFTLYAGLKYLPDSIVAAKVAFDEGTLMLEATGDPTFLHPDFKYQPLLKFLQKPNVEVIRVYTPFATTALGKGWAWDDFKYGYSAERDPFPMYGNMATIAYDYNGDSMRTIPPAIKPFVIGQPEPGGRWEVRREVGGHIYDIDTARGDTEPIKHITMSMNKGMFASKYLADTLHKLVLTSYDSSKGGDQIIIYSQPKDTVFRSMMVNSDNFLAEQTLLMAANQYLGEMNDARMIDTLLALDYASLPQKPRWVDGSGLSRYNLFSPDDLVSVLNMLRNSYGIERTKQLLPTAGEGTLNMGENELKGKLYAKTGSMSNNMALSGYLKTKKNNELAFSIVINNHQLSSTEVRQALEKFLLQLNNN